MTLTQTGDVQRVRLDGPSRRLRLAGTTATTVPGTTHLALTYQPCAASAPVCWGPEEHKMFPVQLDPP
ncbi:MAG: hypothetical protein JWN22_2659 [Nocardioides sp.]|nr:hypothetical protein [Nocardioides sp.]